MSIWIMSQVWEARDVSRDELLVLLALADFADDNGMCWPSVRRIAEKARMTERGVQKITRRLRDMGRLKIKESDGGRNRSNRYQVIVNPERETVNEVRPEPENPERENINPEREDTKPRTPVHPHRTVREPSENHNNTPAQILSPLLGEELAKAVVDHRRKKRAPLTDHSAQLLAKRLSEHSDPIEGAEEMLARGWQGFKAEWMKSDGKRNHTRSEQAAERRLSAIQRAAQCVDGLD